MTTVTVLGSGYFPQKGLLKVANMVFQPDRFNIVDLNPEMTAGGEDVLRGEIGYRGKTFRYHEDFTKYFDYESGEASRIDHEALNCDYAIVATFSPKNDAHIPLAKVFSQNGKPIFMEKPLAQSEEMLQHASKIKVPVQVDYLEIKNPAYQAATEDMEKEGFITQKGYHHRCMLDNCVKPEFHHDALHDVSEILYFRKKKDMERKPEIEVEDFDREIPDQYSTTVLHFPDSEFRIVSSFNDGNERRYFAWLGDNTCYLTNTLSRPNLRPFAIKFAKGREAFEFLRKGPYLNGDLQPLIKDFAGQELDTGKYPQNALVSMMSELMVGDDLTMPIEFASEIERTSFEIYKQAGKKFGLPDHPVYGKITSSLLPRINELR